MAFELTYETLGTTVTSYLQNVSSAITDQMPTFIMLAQRRIAKDCKTLGLETVANPVLTINTSTLQKPDGWKNTLSFGISPLSNPNLPNASVYQQLILRSYEYCQQYIIANNNVSGLPLYYADYEYGSWFLAPKPDYAYTTTIQYMQLPALLDDANQTNWITQNVPECLIYATLYETASFLMDDQRMQTWYQLYSQALTSLLAEDASRKQDRLTNLGAD